MNKHDNLNLNFILSLDREQFIEWYDNASTDDILYASEIMTSAVYETSVNNMHDVTNTTEANQLLKKFML